jgi:hypothetical protein
LKYLTRLELKLSKDLTIFPDSIVTMLPKFFFPSLNESQTFSEKISESELTIASILLVT